MSYSVSVEVDGRLRIFPFDTLKEAVEFASETAKDGSTVPIIKVKGRMVESLEELEELLQTEAEQQR